MNSKRIVGLDVSPWDGPWMSRQQILSRFATSCRVVYSRGALFSWDRFSPLWRAAPWVTRFEDRQGVTLHRRSRLLLRSPRLQAWDDVVVRRIGSHLRRNAGGTEEGPLVAYVFHPSLYPIARALRPDLLLYHAYDQFSAYPGFSRADLERERNLVRDAHLVIGMSELIAENLRRYAQREIHVVPNGADAERFSTRSADDETVLGELAAIPAPRIAYFGNISEKVDLELMRRIARARPDWSLLLVGGERLNRDTSKAAYARLLAQPNVHAVGHKDYGRMPAYMRATDVNILTYRIGEGLWSEACSPLKLYEYLAAGKPVVSTRIGVVEAHADVIAIADDLDGWLGAIEQALVSGGRGTVAGRRAVARANTWDARIRQIDALLEAANS